MSRADTSMWRKPLAAMTALAMALAVAGCGLYFGEDEWNDRNPPPDTVTDPFPPDSEFCRETGGDVGFPAPPSPPLALGPTVTAPVPPPPISGGTLTISSDDSLAVISDPDRDQIYQVSLANNTVLRTIPLLRGDEPGRVALDGTSRAYVALRSGGAVVAIDLATGAVLDRHEVCAAPRGVALDTINNRLYTACHGGELVAIDPATGARISEQVLDNGLRDVVIDADHVYVTVFRTAELLVLNHDGSLERRMKPPTVEQFDFDPVTGTEQMVRFVPSVAWRTLPAPGGGVIMLHQRARKGTVHIGVPGGYGGKECGAGGVVHAAITPLHPGRSTPRNMAVNSAVLPVDFGLFNMGEQAVVVASGNMQSNPEAPVSSPLFTMLVDHEFFPFDCFEPDGVPFFGGQPIATGVTGDNVVLVQAREPAQLMIYADGTNRNPITLSLSSETRKDTGHEVFHLNAGGNVACASCHPGGGTDAVVWEFSCIGPRRTQAFQHGLLGTEPFHWDGDMTSMHKLMNSVFVGRMSGGTPNNQQINAMESWLDKLRPPARSAPLDPVAVDRGRAIFGNAAVGCASCHSGSKLTNNISVDVGTGKEFQVPSLVGLADRAPYMHDGCAPTLLDRFTDESCGGGDRHGVTSHLTSQELDDLVAFLKTL